MTVLAFLETSNKKFIVYLRHFISENVATEIVDIVEDVIYSLYIKVCIL